MSGNFNVHSGVAQTNDLKAALDVGTMAANGIVNLVNQGPEYARDRSCSTKASASRWAAPAWEAI